MTLTEIKKMKEIYVKEADNIKVGWIQKRLNIGQKIKEKKEKEFIINCLEECLKSDGTVCLSCIYYTADWFIK